MEVSKNTEENIMHQVQRDLDPPLKRIALKALAATAFGGAASLVLCGQFGLAFTDWANSFNHNIHHGYGATVCALVCGAIFAAVPAITLRLICRPIEFRAITRNHVVIPLSWIWMAGALLSYHGAFGFEWIAFSAWSFAAALSYWLLIKAIDQLGHSALRA